MIYDSGARGIRTCTKQTDSDADGAPMAMARVVAKQLMDRDDDDARVMVMWEKN